MSKYKTPWVKVFKKSASWEITIQVLGTVVGFSLKKYFDENQSDIFERIENDTKNLIDRMDFSKLDALKQSVYNGSFISFAQYFNGLNQNELEKFDIKNVEECSTIGVSTPILVYEDNQNQIKIDKVTDFLGELNSSLKSILYVLQKDTDIDFKNFSQERQALVKDAYHIVKRSAKLGSWRIIKSYIQNFKP